jgi:hypothetical protein
MEDLVQETQQDVEVSVEPTEVEAIKAQNVDELFKNAVIVCLKRHKWGNVKKIPQEVIEQMTDGVVKDMVRATKDLIAKDAMKDYMYYFNRSRNIVLRYATTIPGIDGMYLINKNVAMKLAKELTECIEKAKVAADEIGERYPEYREAAKVVLEAQGLFNLSDYPASIRDKFGISYNFLTIGVSDAISEFDPEFYAQERAKWGNLMDEARNEAILFWREALQELLNDTADILSGTGDKKRICQNKVDKFEELEKMFQERKIFSDPDLEKLLKISTNLMKGTDAAYLRDNPSAKMDKSAQLKKIKDTLAANTESFKRTVLLD